MEVVSTGSLRTATLGWLLSNGAPALTVVCKATYRLQPDESPLAPEQEPPTEDDSYWDDDARKSLSLATDLVPYKARADVVLVGHAFAPEQKPVRSLAARLMVGPIHKAIEVYGPFVEPAQADRPHARRRPIADSMRPRTRRPRPIGDLCPLRVRRSGSLSRNVC